MAGAGDRSPNAKKSDCRNGNHEIAPKTIIISNTLLSSVVLKFVDRETELASLAEAHASAKPEFFLIYGRRRIGKTELVKRFASDKRHFYFLAKEQAIEVEVERLGEKFSEKFNVHIERTGDLEKLFEQILKNIDPDEKFVVVIDEFPFWVSKQRKVLSDIQSLWDELLRERNLFLILLGSSVSMMEHEVMAYRSPLYGRRTGQLRIEPMRPKHLKEFLPRYSWEDLIKVFGAAGGVPFYLKEFTDGRSFQENIEKTFFNKSNILYEEAEVLLREALREVHVYFNIMKAITDGATRMSEIAQKSRVDTTNINKYLSVLMSLGFVSKRHSITEPPKLKNMRYGIEDNYFRFWIRYVYPHKEEIEEDPATMLKIFERDHPAYMGGIFEDFCSKMMRELDLPVVNEPGTLVGKWWHKGNEIDVAAINEDRKELLLAECKWKGQVDGQELFERLENKSELVDWHKGSRKVRLAVFAKSFRIRPESENVHAFDLHDIERALGRRKSG